MSINTIGGNPTPTEQRRASTQDTQAPGNNAKATTGDKSADRAAGGESVQISSSAIDLQALESRINELPEVDQARVTELRNQIANGSYEVDSQQVAAKILAFESEL